MSRTGTTPKEERLAELLWNEYGRQKWNALDWNVKDEGNKLRWRYDARKILRELESYE